MPVFFGRVRADNAEKPCVRRFEKRAARCKARLNAAECRAAEEREAEACEAEA